MKLKLGLYLALLAMPVCASQKSWKGQISDSMCGAGSAMAAAGQKVDPRECNLMCAKSG